MASQSTGLPRTSTGRIRVRIELFSNEDKRRFKVVEWVFENRGGTIAIFILWIFVAGLDVIEVARADGTSRMVLISEDLDEPRAIVVYPQKG